MIITEANKYTKESKAMSKYFTADTIADEQRTQRVLDRAINGLARLRVVMDDDRQYVAEMCQEAKAAWPTGPVANTADAFLKGAK